MIFEFFSSNSRFDFITIMSDLERNNSNEFFVNFKLILTSFSIEKNRENNFKYLKYNFFCDFIT